MPLKAPIATPDDLCRNKLIICSAWQFSSFVTRTDCHGLAGYAKFIRANDKT